MAQDGAMLVISCSCGQKMKVPAEALGKTATCVKCGERLRISVETADPTDLPMPAPPRKNAAREETSAAPPPAEPEALRLVRQHGLLSDRAIDEVRLLQQDFQRSLWDLLTDIGHLTSADFHTVMSKQKGIASIDLPNYHIPGEVLEVIPADLARRGMLVPVDRLGKLLTLAMACPIDTDVIQEVEAHTGLRVKSMLATVDALRRMIDTCYPKFDGLMFVDESGTTAVAKEFENLLATNEVARRVMSVDSFAPPAETSDEIRALLDAGGNGTTLRAVADMVSMDPVTTTMILRVSNSDAYGFPQRVDGLGLACTLLGPQAIGAIVRSSETKIYRGTREGFDYDRFWARARFCGEAAQSIAMQANSQTAITAYTAALVHDIGRLGFVMAAPKSYPALTHDLSGPARAELEMRVYHITSTEVGYMFARKWNLPANLAEAIRFHREPERARNARDLTNVVALAVMMADAFEREMSLNLDRAEDLCAALKLSRSETIRIYQETRESSTPQGANA